MPTIRKQKVQSSNGRVEPDDAALDDIQPIGNLRSPYLNCLIYGGNRTGKSTLACQFPKPLLLLSLEPNQTGGAMSVAGMEGVYYKRVTTTEQFDAIAQALRAQKLLSRSWEGELQTVVIDSGTAYQEILIREIVGESQIEALTFGRVSKDQYIERSTKIKERMRPYLDLPCHTVILAKEKDLNPSKEAEEVYKPKMVRSMQAESMSGPDMGAVGWVADACDYICRLYTAKEVIVKKMSAAGETYEREVETGRSVRRLQTQLDTNMLAGFRSCNPSAIPLWIEAPTPAEMFEAMIQVVGGERTQWGKY